MQLYIYIVFIDGVKFKLNTHILQNAQPQNNTWYVKVQHNAIITIKAFTLLFNLNVIQIMFSLF